MPSDYNDIVYRNFEEIKQPFINFLHKNFYIGYDDIMDIYTNVWIDVRENIRNGKTDRVKSWKSYIFTLGWRQACKFKEREKKIPSFDDETFNSAEFLEQYRKEREAEKSIYNDPDIKAVLAAELSYIPDPCCKILKMYYFDEMSMSVIADSLNYSSSRSAITTKNRCLDKLKMRVRNTVRRLGILDK